MLYWIRPALIILISIFIPSGLMYLGENPTTMYDLQYKQIIGSGVDIDKVANTMFFSGLVLSGLIFPIQVVSLKNQIRQTESKIDNVIEASKNILDGNLKLHLRVSGRFNVRIFVPERKWCQPWYKIHRMRKVLVIKNHEKLGSKEMTRGLYFEVHPKIQGLVGQAYTRKEILYDLNLREEGKSEYYNLTEYQQHVVERARFVIAAPIFNMKGKVVAIISIDSDQSIILSRDKIKLLKRIMSEYSKFIHQFAYTFK